MAMDVSLVIDGSLALLLGVTLLFVARLNRRIGELKRERARLDGAIERFAAATTEAQKTLIEMRQIAGAEGKTLQEAVKKGAGLADDLEFLIGRAGTAADRLEAAIGQSRQAVLKAVPAAGRETGEREAPARESAAGKGPARGTGSRDGDQAGAAATAPARRPVVVDALPEGERALLRALAGLR
jgi:hypothetical protein